jgi:hypothetical protein
MADSLRHRVNSPAARLKAESGGSHNPLIRTGSDRFIAAMNASGKTKSTAPSNCCHNVSDNA